MHTDTLFLVLFIVAAVVALLAAVQMRLQALRQERGDLHKGDGKRPASPAHGGKGAGHREFREGVLGREAYEVRPAEMDARVLHLEEDGER
ncbi:MAG: hypothetical protein ABI679_15855 [Gemmatimonadota bacterium]